MDIFIIFSSKILTYEQKHEFRHEHYNAQKKYF